MTWSSHCRTLKRGTMRAAGTGKKKPTVFSVSRKWCHRAVSVPCHATVTANNTNTNIAEEDPTLARAASAATVKSSLPTVDAKT
jgi:hypothetical protein